MGFHTLIALTTLVGVLLALREPPDDTAEKETMMQNPPDSRTYLIPRHYLLISEVNLDSSSVLNNQFIEIQAVDNPFKPRSNPGNNLAGYRLLVVMGHPLQIVTSLDLNQHVPNLRKEFITIGTKNVRNLDIDLESPDCPTIYKRTGSVLPPFDDTPFAVILLHTSKLDEHEALQLTQADGSFSPISIMDDMWRQNIIRRTAMDIVVLGCRTPTNRCGFFDTVFPQGSFEPIKSYLLRDWDSDRSPEKDMSVNRCCKDELPFSPKCFVLSYISPGEKNDCRRGRRFILAEHAKWLKSQKPKKNSVPVLGCEANYNNVDENEMAVEPQSYFTAVESAFAQRTECLKAPSNDSANENSENTNSADATVAPLFGPDIIDFDDERFNECQHIFTYPQDIVISDAVEWLRFANSSAGCRFHCHACREFVRLGFRPDIKVRADIVRAKGSLSKSQATNSMMVRNHRNHKLHENAIKFYRQYKASTTDAQRREAVNSQYRLEKEVFTPTMNVIQLAYVEFTAGVSFKSHKKFMNGVSELGVNVGVHHRHDKAMADISDVLAKGFHFNLLRNLVTQDKHFTVIVDGTTIDNVPYLAVMLQTLEDARPIVYVYGLLVLTNGEAGESMVKDLTNRISQDDKIYPGFEAFFKKNCMVLASDQASPMIGRHNSFYTHLQTYLGREISLVKCGAHKLSRILVHALDYDTDETTNATYFAKFAEINNKFYSFYMSRGSKRFIELTKKAEELGITPNRIKYHFDIRFAASQHRCMKTLYDQFDALKLDLLERVSDPTFDQEGRNMANMLHSYISDKGFAITVAEFVDLLEIFQKMSRRFQLKGGLMIGNVEIVRDGYHELVLLRNAHGKVVSEFLGRVKCDGVCEPGQCTLSQYDSCPEIITRTRTLEASMPDSIKLGEHRDTLYERILEQMKIYFEPELLEAFDLFNPKFFKFCPTDSNGSPTNCGQLQNCYVPFPTVDPFDSPQSPGQKFAKVCNFYKMSQRACETVYHDWTNVLTSMVNDETVFDQRLDDVSVFWPNMLGRSDLSLTVSIRSLFEKILITSFTSSDAERLFSQVSRIKTPERFHLKPNTLEGLVRIQFNGPEVLSRERLFEYTRRFLLNHVRSDDTQHDGGRPPAPEEFPHFFARSRIF